MYEVDQSETPEGLIAVACDSIELPYCKKCFFYGKKVCSSVKCCWSERKDKKAVIFIVDETNNDERPELL